MGPTKAVRHTFPSISAFERPVDIFVPNCSLGKDIVITKEFKAKVSSKSLLFSNHLEVSHAISLIFFSNSPLYIYGFLNISRMGVSLLLEPQNSFVKTTFLNVVVLPIF